MVEEVTTGKKRKIKVAKVIATAIAVLTALAAIVGKTNADDHRGVPDVNATSAGEKPAVGSDRLFVPTRNYDLELKRFCESKLLKKRVS